MPAWSLAAFISAPACVIIGGGVAPRRRESVVLDTVTVAAVPLALDLVRRLVLLLEPALARRPPRPFLQAYVALAPPARLRAVRDHLRAKAEIFTGFLFLLGAFPLQTVPPLGSPPLPPAPPSPRVQIGAFVLL